MDVLVGWLVLALALSQLFYLVWALTAAWVLFEEPAGVHPAVERLARIGGRLVELPMDLLLLAVAPLAVNTVDRLARVPRWPRAPARRGPRGRRWRRREFREPAPWLRGPSSW
jgi:hypothetical protein